VKQETRFAGSSVGRRSWMKAAVAMTAPGLLPRELAAASSRAVASAVAGSIVASDAAAIAQTTYGKVRGFVHREIFVFRGIPYGASTAGDRRFMAPARPRAWTGVRSALSWGFASPQIPPEHWDKDEVAFVYEWNPGAQGEDCLRLNVWTPGLDHRLVTAAQIAAKKVYPAPDYSSPLDFGRHCEFNPWGPTVDGAILPEHPFRTGAPAASAGVPLIVGSTLTEFGVGFLNPDFEKLTFDELRGRLAGSHHVPRQRLLGEGRSRRRGAEGGGCRAEVGVTRSRS
jgi:carboxylesterase type B